MNMIFMVVLMYLLSLASDRDEHQLVDPTGKLEKSWVRKWFPLTACDNWQELPAAITYILQLTSALLMVT